MIRSNYFYPVSSAFYDHSLKLYEGLSRELNYNVMLSQRGLITLAHSEHELQLNRRWANATSMNDIESKILTPSQIRRLVPIINLRSRYPITGGFVQWRAGICRLSPIGIKEPGMIGVMDPVLGVKNGHPWWVKNVRV